MIRRALAALGALSFGFALTAHAAGDPRPCLGQCRVSLGKCVYEGAGDREQCLKRYADCSKICHERAGTNEE